MTNKDSGQPEQCKHGHCPSQQKKTLLDPCSREAEENKKTVAAHNRY
jgi:hypothetical protein